MPNEEWGNIGLKKVIIDRLDKRKVHPNQSYGEVIELLLDATEEYSNLIQKKTK